MNWGEIFKGELPYPPDNHDYEPGQRNTSNCPGCGRFAKYVGDEHYYNGTWDCYRYTTRCKKCGDLDTECV